MAKNKKITLDGGPYAGQQILIGANTRQTLTFSAKPNFKGYYDLVRTRGQWVDLSAEKIQLPERKSIQGVF